MVMRVENEARKDAEVSPKKERRGQSPYSRMCLNRNQEEARFQATSEKDVLHIALAQIPITPRPRSNLKHLSSECTKCILEGPIAIKTV
jgi:hypothetical protein